GAVTRTYTYGLQRIDQNQVINGAWTPSYYGYDGGGNVRQLTNSAGAVTDSYEYDAYGNHWTVEGSTSNNMLYRGEEWDPDLSLLYLRARYMNPLTGRFLSRDPEDGDLTNPATLHKYLYAGGDPMNGIDPTGRLDLVELDVRFEKFLRKAPTWVTFGKQFAACVIALGKTIYHFNQLAPGEAPSASDFTFLGTCGKFLFSSFRIIYAATP